MLKPFARILSGAKASGWGLLTANPNRKNPVKMSTEENAPKLGAYLKSLDKEKLNQVLDEVLTECRRRDSEQIKKDILTHSQSLRLINFKR